MDRTPSTSAGFSSCLSQRYISPEGKAQLDGQVKGVAVTCFSAVTAATLPETGPGALVLGIVGGLTCGAGSGLEPLATCGVKAAKKALF